jgi:DME family drug/metabolite transporter
MQNTSRGSAEWLGYLQVVLAATIWGASGVLAKYVMGQAVSPMSLSEIRITVAATTLLCVLLVKNRQLLRIRWRDLPYMFALGVIGVAGVSYTYYCAISRTNVATAVLLQYTAPAFIMLFAVLFQGETLSTRKLLSLCLAFSGCFLVVGGYNLSIFVTNKAGIIAALLSAGFFAFYSLYAEYGLKTYPVWTILFYGFAFAALFWWCLQPPWIVLTAGYPRWVWLLSISLGMFSTLVSFSLYFSGIRRIKATQASITAMLEPVVAGLAAYLFLGEKLSFLQVIGGILVLVGIFLLQRARGRK